MRFLLPVEGPEAVTLIRSVCLNTHGEQSASLLCFCSNHLLQKAETCRQFDSSTNLRGADMLCDSIFPSSMTLLQFMSKPVRKILGSMYLHSSDNCRPANQVRLGCRRHLIYVIAPENSIEFTGPYRSMTVGGLVHLRPYHTRGVTKFGWRCSQLLLKPRCLTATAWTNRARTGPRSLVRKTISTTSLS